MTIKSSFLNSGFFSTIRFVCSMNLNNSIIYMVRKINCPLNFKVIMKRKYPRRAVAGMATIGEWMDIIDFIR